MVSPVSASHKKQDSFILCHPLVRITGVALLAIGASALTAAVSRDPIALRQTISLIWGSFILYIFIECIFADMFTGGSSSSRTRTTLIYNDPSIGGGNTYVYTDSPSYKCRRSSYSGSSSLMPPSHFDTETRSKNKELSSISNYGSTGRRSSSSTSYSASSGDFGGSTSFGSSSFGNTGAPSYSWDDHKTGGFGKAGTCGSSSSSYKSSSGSFGGSTAFGGSSSFGSSVPVSVPYQDQKTGGFGKTGNRASSDECCIS